MNTNQFPESIKDELNALANQYEFSESSDKGANGYVVFGKNRITKKLVALKFYSNEPGDGQHREPEIMSKIKSDNILEVIDAKSIQDDWAYYITPRCDGGDLDGYINNNVTFHTAIKILQGVCSGVSVLHSNDIIHRDLKPGNILVDNEVPKIADFGSVKLLETGEKEVVASKHSVLYRPPESFRSRKYSKQGDIYQVGLIFYQLLGGRLHNDLLVYLNKSQLRQYSRLKSDCDRSIFVDRIIEGIVCDSKLAKFSSLPNWVSRNTKSLIKKCINNDMRKRIKSITDVSSELTSIYNRSFDWYQSNDCPEFRCGDDVYQFRPLSSDTFQVYRNSGSGFRKVPNVRPSKLETLIDRFVSQNRLRCR